MYVCACWCRYCSLEYVRSINAYILELMTSYFNFLTKLQSSCKCNVLKRITILRPKFED